MEEDILYEYNGSNAQLWKFSKSGNYYYIKNKLGYYLDNSNGSTNNANNVIVYSYNGTAAQKWKPLGLILNNSKAVTRYTNRATYLRSETSTKKSICSIPKNTAIKTYFTQGNWTYVIYKGKRGYIQSKYLSKTAKL